MGAIEEIKTRITNTSKISLLKYKLRGPKQVKKKKSLNAFPYLVGNSIEAIKIG